MILSGVQVDAVYSQECVSIDGSLVFDQIPYFEVVDRLKKQIDDLQEEKNTLEHNLLNTQVLITYSKSYSIDSSFRLR